jgi:hypothetical protein
MTSYEVIHRLLKKACPKNNFREHKKEQTLVMGEIL